MNAIPQWTVNTAPRVMPENREYSPKDWTFYATKQPSETLEAWIGRDWALRCRAEGHHAAAPRSTMPASFSNPFCADLNHKVIGNKIMNLLRDGEPRSIESIMAWCNLTRHTARHVMEPLIKVGAIALEKGTGGKSSMYSHASAKRIQRNSGKFRRVTQ